MTNTDRESQGSFERSIALGVSICYDIWLMFKSLIIFIYSGIRFLQAVVTGSRVRCHSRACSRRRPMRESTYCVFPSLPLIMVMQT